MNQKIIGYVLSAVGLAGLLVSSFPKILEQTSLKLPEILLGKNLMIGSVILIVLGVVLSFGNKKKQETVEVPIYEDDAKGRRVVAYKREIYNKKK